MHELRFPDTSGTSLSADAAVDDRVLTLRLRGVADHTACTAVAAVVATTRAEAQRLEVRSVVVDLNELEFMSSACIKNLVSWLARLQEGTQPPPYTVTFVPGNDLPWQHKTLEALQRLAPDVVSVDR